MIIKPMELCTTYCSKCKERGITDPLDKVTLCGETLTVLIDNKKIKLTNRGFRVFCALYRCKVTPVDFDYLQEWGWPDNLVVRNNLTVTISEVRKSLRHTNLKIHNVRGFGYALTTSKDHEKQTSKGNVIQLQELECLV